MSDEPYDYDPGTPHEPPPSRRRRRHRDYRRPSEHDDAWAAADDMADEYDVDPASLAAGYDWEDRDRYGVDADRRRRDWRDDAANGDPPERPPAHPRSAPVRRSRDDRPPADLGPMPREADEMRRRRDHFSPHDSPRVARRTDPRTGSRDHRSRDREDYDHPRDYPRARDRAQYDDPHYHRNRARRHEHAEYHRPRDYPKDAPRRERRERPEYYQGRYADDPLPPQKQKRKPSPTGADGILSGIPTWQLVMIVGMAVIAFLAVAFTCVMLLTLI